MKVTRTTFKVGNDAEPCIIVSNNSGSVKVRISTFYHLVGENTLMMKEYVNGEANNTEEYEGDFETLTDDYAIELALEFSAYLKDAYLKDNEPEETLSIADAVKKWSFWCFNFHTPFEETICKIWGGTISNERGLYVCRDNCFTQHLIEKWRSLEKRGDARMLFFFCNLDTKHKDKLIDYVMKNYGG